MNSKRIVSVRSLRALMFVSKFLYVDTNCACIFQGVWMWVKEPCLFEFANTSLAFFCNEPLLLLSLICSPHCLPPPPLLLAAELLRRRTCLALINVLGIRLALQLSLPLPSLLQLHPTFWPCNCCTQNTSRLQLQLVLVSSGAWKCVHTRRHAHTHTGEVFPARSFSCHRPSFPSFTPAVF